MIEGSARRPHLTAEREERVIRGSLLIYLGLIWCAGSAGADPVARWNFGAEETTHLVSHAGVHRDQPGPRPPEFPDFDPDNTAVRFDGSGAHYSFADPGDNSPFDFTNGDAITLEAWVNMAEVKGGENLYIIGKGRTGEPTFAKDNQNWALRVREAQGKAHLSFLFATPVVPNAAAKDAHWHRWTSIAGFAPGSGWHHLAVSYKFGDPKSIRGWIDGKSTEGAWDMGGATTAAPVVDNDAIWIGSSQGGNTANSFRGLLDEIAIHREILSDDVMRSRYRRLGAEPTATAPVAEVMPQVADIPAGRVLVTYHEGLATHDRWPSAGATVPAESMRWLTREMAIPRLPLRYDDWGILTAWKGPVLVRAAADIQLLPGKQQFLMRARGMGRLWVNGAMIARTKAHNGTGDGHEPVKPIPAPPLPGLRPLDFGDEEGIGQAEIAADGRCRIIVEVLVGGKKFRPEPGEMCVAVKSTDRNSFVLIQPGAGEPEPLTDAVWQAVNTRAETELTAMDNAARHAAEASQDTFWKTRHEIARNWVQTHPAPMPPKSKSADSGNVIDQFIQRRIDLALANSAGAAGEQAKQFHASVLPVLAENCFRCHGEKSKGGLRLNTRQAALAGGDSGKPAIVPGDPSKSEMLARLCSTDSDERMPPKGDGLPPAQIAILENWIKSGAAWPTAPIAAADVARPPAVTDAAFLRRISLDTIGVQPTEDDARAFLTDLSPDKRARLIGRLLADDRFADHWVAYWQDVLAENPSILKPSLNNSGPFRWFLYDAIRDGKGLDRLVTELILMRGGKAEGGSAGFGVASDNDAPMAAKGQILGSAFLGLELQCARCHDAPFHSIKQKDLYSLAAMLDRKTVTVPKTSTVPAAFFERKARESLIKVTLKPSEPITPQWPFAKACGVNDDATLDPLLQYPKDTRERLAALITAPQNHRFAQVIVNRVWKRMMGAGLVEPAGDWEGHAPSDPDLLAYLAAELVSHDYDLKHIVRLIANSQAYQREATGQNLKAPADQRFFAAPDRRRLAAEQVVDSLYCGAGKAMNVEELTFDPDSRRPADSFISLGKPTRAWMFASLSNERDRPSLSLPRAQAVTDVLEAFGWSGARQGPRTDRETDPNVLQPGVLANGMMSTWICRVSSDTALADLAIRAESPEPLVDSIFLRFLTRLPNSTERTQCVQALAPGFNTRLMLVSASSLSAAPPRLPRVAWSNHLVSEANQIKLEMEHRARAGDPPDPRLDPAWREALEDVVWGIINGPEFVWVP